MDMFNNIIIIAIIVSAIIFSFYILSIINAYFRNKKVKKMSDELAKNRLQGFMSRSIF